MTQNPVYKDTIEAEEHPLDFRRLIQGLRRRAWIVAIASVGALIPALAYVATRPAVYQATAKVSIEPTPEVMDVGADVMPGEPSRRGGRGGVVASMKALALSGAVLGRIVDRTAPPATPEPGRLDRLRSRIGLEPERVELDPEQQRQRRIAGLRSGISIGEEGAGTVLLVSSQGSDPVGVAALVNGVAEALIEFRREQRDAAAQRALAWLNQRAYELRDRIERKEETLSALTEREGLDLLGLSRRDEASKTRLTAELQTTRIDLLTTQQRLAELRVRVRRVDEAPVESEEAARVRERHAEAVAALEAARLRFTPTHPEVRRLEGMVSTLSGRLRAREPMVGANAASDREELTTLEAEASRLHARSAALERALQELSPVRGEDAGARAEYERLQRELNLDRRMLEILLQRRNETLITAATDHTDAQILDYAVPPGAPIAPRRRKLLVLSAGFAVSFGFGLGLLLEMVDRRVREPEQVAAILEAQLLGVIPSVRRGGPAERQGIDHHASSMAESFRNLRTALLFAVRNRQLKTLVVTSAVAGEGKTTVSSNLAASFARSGRRTLLVDADLRRPRISSVFALEREPGLAELLLGDARLEEAIRRPIGCDFDVLTSGKTPRNPSELLASRAFDNLKKRLADQYDLVLVDSPVILAVSDALVIAAAADGTLLVSKPGTLDQGAYERMRVALHQADAKVLGVVFNQVERGDPYAYPSYLESPYVESSRRKRRRQSSRGKISSQVGNR